MANQSGLSHNADEAAKQFRILVDEIPDELLLMGTPILTRLGASATSDFMVDAGVGAGRRPPGSPGPLRIVTGRLARSLTGAATQGARESINVITLDVHGLTIVKGSKVPYAGVHEYGMQKTVHVRAHQRTEAFGRNVGPFQVGAFSRRMNIPARPYLAPAAEKSAKWILEFVDKRLRTLVKRVLG